MTLRLRLSSPEPGWTELFRAGPALRPMRVMADAEALNDHSDPVAGGLLAGLLSDEDIHLWRYSDNGPPPATRCVRTALGQPVTAGWAVTAAAPLGGLATYTLSWATGRYGYQADLVGEPVLAASAAAPVLVRRGPLVQPGCPPRAAAGVRDRAAEATSSPACHVRENPPPAASGPSAHATHGRDATPPTSSPADRSGDPPRHPPGAWDAIMLSLLYIMCIIGVQTR